MECKKIPAFTLMEITIVLLLSMILIGIILLGYKNFEQYRGMQKKSSQELSEVLLMHTRLSNHFENSNLIRYEKEERRLVFSDTTSFATCWIQNNQIVFQHLHEKDTMNVKILDLVIGEVQNTKLVDHLSFVIGMKEKSTVFDYKKDYGKALLFNLKDVNDEY